MMDDWFAASPYFTGYQYEEAKKDKCECGVHVTYGKEYDLHSDWCPLYKKIEIEVTHGQGD